MLAVVRPILYGGPGAAAEKEAEILAAAKEIASEIEKIDEALAERAYLVGDRITAADIAIYPGVMLVARAADRARVDLGIALPANVAAWRTRIEAIPGYDATYPPSWRSEGLGGRGETS